VLVASCGPGGGSLPCATLLLVIEAGGSVLHCVAAPPGVWNLTMNVNDYEYVLLDSDDIHDYLMDENKWLQLPWEDTM